MDLPSLPSKLHVTCRASLVAVVIAAASPAMASPESADSERQETEERATLLATNLARYPRMEKFFKVRQVVGIVGGGVELALGSAMFATADDSNTRTLALPFVGGGTAVLGGAILSYAVDPDYAEGVLDVASELSAGSLDLFLGLGAQQSPNPILPAPVGFMLASGQFAQASLRVVDMAARRPTSFARLADHYRRLRDPTRRAALVADDVALVETDLEHAGLEPLGERRACPEAQAVPHAHAAWKVKVTRIGVLEPVQGRL